MTEAQVVIRSALGLHARPAGELVTACRGFASRIRVACGAKEADGRSIVSLLGLGVQSGATVIIRADGADEAAAVAALQQLLAGWE
ncbi:MAG TPA: HPr family phosphocarrier protein [Symbiobacteriaceae bacterium]|jgi:phosphotransferase system HPr (HPr) family protein